MSRLSLSARFGGAWRRARPNLAAACCALLLLDGNVLMVARAASPPPPEKPPADKSTAPAAAPGAEAEKPAPKIPPEQLDSLVAPIALYPDSLLAQTLVASTYPLELVQLQQWLAKNPKLKDK